MAQRGLLFTDAESNWVGELAAEVPSLTNGGVSEDGLTVTYGLRDGISWHDGEPVTSADVQATWDMIMNPDCAVITRFGYDKIEAVETPDPLTAVLRFREPFASWPILFDAIIPKHVIEANAADLDNSEAMRQPVGFGPLRSWSGDRGDRSSTKPSMTTGAVARGSIASSCGSCPASMPSCRRWRPRKSISRGRSRRRT